MVQLIVALHTVRLIEINQDNTQGIPKTFLQVIPFQYKMPKVKESNKSLFRKYAEEFDSLSTDGSVLRCNPCGKIVNTSKRFLVLQHVQGKVHLQNLEIQKKRQLFVSTQLEQRSEYDSLAHDLCKAFSSADIPLLKLENQQIRSFIENCLNGHYSAKRIPSESCIRRKNVDFCYEETRNQIRETIKGEKIWVSIDETVDSTGRYVANVVFLGA